ncbi:MAG: 30S ribosomal protein S15 [Bacillales bacterium]|nr:30S ribosomal protein S15 [Bacillales bacterium]
MALTKQQKADIIAKFGANENDTGSTKVQIALLTAEINALTAHLKKNHGDGSSRRGLFAKVGQRKGFLAYLQKTDYEGYVALIKELGIRK